MVKLFFFNGKIILVISPTVIFVCLIYTYFVYARHFHHCLQLNLDET